MTEAAEVTCPYCWETITLDLDLSAGEAHGASAGDLIPMAPASQAYTEDCPVCCQPLLVRLDVAADGSHAVEVQREND